MPEPVRARPQGPSHRLCIELGDVASPSRLFLFGSELYCLETAISFAQDVKVRVPAAPQGRGLA